jgi:tetratricopeptide (TPR) repeat protein
MNQPHVYYSQLYRNFRAIEAGEFRKVVYFYERHEKEIRQLEFEEYFELLVAYTQALFAIESFQKHLLMADVVIEISFAENITELNGQEIFRSTLFQKAVSYYHLYDFQKAIYVLTELVKINPNSQKATYFLEKCLRKSRPKFVKNTRAIAIFFILLTAVVVAIDVLFIRNFAINWLPLIGLIRNSTLILGIFILMSGELIHWIRARLEVFKLVNSVKKTKKSR